MIRVGVDVLQDHALLALGYEPKTNASPQEFAAVVASDLERFGKIIKETGIRAD